MNNTLIYHYPHCSKSCETLRLLKEKGIEPIVIEYIKAPPDMETLMHLLQMLNLAPRELMRHKEEKFQTLKLDNPRLSDQELIQAMILHPCLIERPIVVHGNKAAVGRPPEAVLALFS